MMTVVVTVVVIAIIKKNRFLTTYIKSSLFSFAHATMEKKFSF